MRTLVVNTGSSSLKLQVLEDSTLVGEKLIERWDGGAGGTSHGDELTEFVTDAGGVDVVGHRVVHGGARYSSSVIIDDEVVDYLATLVDLAPLHEPNALRGIEAMREALPSVPQVACFDTAFHATMPLAAVTYALPKEWNEQWNLRRYGFHGLSHSYASRRGAQLVGQDVQKLRIVNCHLGSGASLCAIVGGQSVDTTMGFTPLEGLVMGTRSGSVDPGLLIWLLEHGNLSLGEVNDALEKHGGLAGLSGTSGDLRDVLEAGTAEAQLALDVYLHRLARCTGEMVASAGGLDLLIFTGGVGEHRASVRQSLSDSLSYLGVVVDQAVNDSVNGDVILSSSESKVAVAVVECREDLEIEREARRLV
ncbi:MAG: acetate/propionate family kinase [Candidatus Nanopelagicales bacterium]